MRQTHIWSSLIISLIMLVFLFYIIPNYTSPPDSALDLSPNFIPKLAVSVTLLLSIFLGVSALLTHKSDEDLHEEFGEESSGIGWLEIKNVFLWSVLSIGAWYGTDNIGFEPTMTVCLTIGLIFSGVRNYWLTALIAIVMPIVLSQVAWYVFTTELPGFWRT